VEDLGCDDDSRGGYFDPAAGCSRAKRIRKSDSVSEFEPPRRLLVRRPTAVVTAAPLAGTDPMSSHLDREVPVSPATTMLDQYPADITVDKTVLARCIDA
jgi:hypothetical protein